MNINLSNRTGVGIALIFITTLVVLILVQTGHVSAQKGAKLYPIELSATLRSDPGDAIYSDKLGVPYTSNRITSSYPNDVILREPGTLYMRIQKNRRVYFRFDATSRFPSTYEPASTMVTCHEYSVDGMSGKGFSENKPAFLANGGVVELINDITFITTGASVRYVADTGWVADATLPTIANMAEDGTPLYVWMNISFNTIDEDESFFLHHGYELWTGLNPRTGIAKVTHPGPDTWVLVPLPPDDPDHPLRSLGGNDASLTMTVGRDVKAGHQGGYCDLGYWEMPFELTLKRR
jgi:hypothetical protein